VLGGGEVKARVVCILWAGWFFSVCPVGGAAQAHTALTACRAGGKQGGGLSCLLGCGVLIMQPLHLSYGCGAGLGASCVCMCVCGGGGDAGPGVSGVRYVGLWGAPSRVANRLSSSTCLQHAHCQQHQGLA